MPTPLRVGLVGYGLAGGFFHAPFIPATPDFAVASVITSDPERRAAAEHEIPGVQLLGSAEELWTRAGEHDVAVVATPNRLHATVARAALEAGLHVVVEKPFAARADEARALVEEARSRGRVLTVYHNRRWDGAFLTIAQILAAGSIGQVTRFESRFERWQPDPNLPAWRQGSEPDAAGGLIYDLG